MKTIICLMLFTSISYADDSCIDYPYRFHYNQSVKVYDPRGFYNGCNGKVYDSWQMKNNLPMYIIHLYSCNGSKVDRKIRGGEEYFEVIK